MRVQRALLYRNGRVRLSSRDSLIDDINACSRLVYIHRLPCPVQVVAIDTDTNTMVCVLARLSMPYASWEFFPKVY